jgi:hypothetical protein
MGALRATRELVHEPYFKALDAPIDDVGAIFPGARAATTTSIPVGTRMAHVRMRVASAVFQHAPGAWRRLRS